MKKNIYILFLLLTVALSSCAKIEDGEDSTKTKQGYLVFTSALTYCNQVMSLTDLIAKTDLYLKSTDSERKYIQQLYLSNYEIEKDPYLNRVTLISSTTKYVLEYDSFLETANAVWDLKDILSKDDKDQWINITPADFSFRVQNRDGINWIVAFNNFPLSYPYGYISTTVSEYQSGSFNVTPSILENGSLNGLSTLNNYKIDGSSKIISDLTLDIRLLSPTEYIGGQLDVAKATIDVIQRDSTVDEVEGYFNQSTIEITFKGIKETYNMFMQSYYLY